MADHDSSDLNGRLNVTLDDVFNCAIFCKNEVLKHQADCRILLLLSAAAGDKMRRLFFSNFYLQKAYTGLQAYRPVVAHNADFLFSKNANTS